MADVKEHQRTATSAAYDEDFHRWSNRQAELLREGRFAELDMPNLIEEIEDMGSEKRRALQSSYRVLIMHLLKWRHQPDRRSRAWRLTITRERGEIEDLEEENPSLAHKAHELAAKAYKRAIREAVSETGLPIATLPAECPFTLAQLRDDAFLPD